MRVLFVTPFFRVGGPQLNALPDVTRLRRVVRRDVMNKGGAEIQARWARAGSKLNRQPGRSDSARATSINKKLLLLRLLGLLDCFLRLLRLLGFLRHNIPHRV